MYCKSIKTTINVACLIKIIINILLRFYNLLKSIISNQSHLFILKFLFLLYYFLGIKQMLSTTFQLQIDD